MYKQASQMGLRVNTPKGSLSVEQLWALSMIDLQTTARNLKKLMKADTEDGLEFLEEVTSIDKTTELSFNIVKDIYVTKKDAAKAISDAAEIKAHNQKILAIIAEKKDIELGSKSIKELEKLLK